MSAWAKPGVRCVCIKNSTRIINYQGMPPFLKGQTFTIAGVVQNEFGVALYFEERGPNQWAHISGFRPLIERTQEQDLEHFLPLLNTVEEPA